MISYYIIHKNPDNLTKKHLTNNNSPLQYKYHTHKENNASK